jgi:hypothetical protein
MKWPAFERSPILGREGVVRPSFRFVEKPFDS